ncbi:dinitrogenase iron-molybdenum cofactor biosynthesis protein [Methanobrevibacter sp. OttesenSCG-928-K11]|nr:dinitrogenase iron-molybdenum cofactor biosynthesis protein [Methanobrevibacter sp. OttesenSCG-928-K11]MDL2270249.1 dinitrogenase iron-molybdenum cofactor biosynthesis protein [Methanobrevibacter sp. OttesenSCG-928-I08]
MKIAITSNDGENVDTHLGKSLYLSIYDVDGDDFNFIERRETGVDVSEKHSGGIVLELAQDCDVIITAKYGFKSKIKADNANIKLVEDEGPIDEVLKRYIDHVKFLDKPINF